MPTYTKETALYDTGAIKEGIDNAGTKAEKYITKVDNAGITVHPYNDSTGSAVTANRAQINATGMTIYKDNNDVATFGETARIGRDASGYSRTEITSNGVQFIRKTSSSAETVLANIGYGQGQASSGTGTAPYYTFGKRATSGATLATSYDPGNLSAAFGQNNIAQGYASQAEGSVTEAIGTSSHAEGQASLAAGNYSHAEGTGTRAVGEASHAEGYYTEANDYYSHVEGNQSYANGVYSHAEGFNSDASGNASHAEGNSDAGGDYSHAEGSSDASGDYSHAEGFDTFANGDHSHAQNYGTIASSDNQTVLGKYNIEDNADAYSVIIGNGTANNSRSNALTVDWSGNIFAAGKTTHLCYANNITSTAIGATGTEKKIPINAINDYNDSNEFFSYDSSSKGIKVLKDGVYLISVQAGANPATSGDLMGLQIYKNGSSAIGPEYRRVGGNYDTVVLMPTVVSLSAGDVLTLYGRNNTSARGTFTSCRFTILRI